MANPEDETHIDLRTSCTRDEAVAMMLGLINGPVCARPSNDDATQEEWEIINSYGYSLQDDLEERRDALESEVVEAQLEKLDPNDIGKKQEALQNFHALVEKARIYSLHIDDEIAKGELSALREDKQAKGNSIETRYTVISIKQWAKANTEISALDPFPRHGKTNSSSQPDSQQQDKPESGKTKLEHLFTTFAFLVEAFAKHSNSTTHEDGRPKISMIATRLERLAKEANKQEVLPGQSEEAIKKRISEAMRIKQSKLPKA